jgi:hypothetical protein
MMSCGGYPDGARALDGRVAQPVLRGAIEASFTLGATSLKLADTEIAAGEEPCQRPEIHDHGAPARPGVRPHGEAHRGRPASLFVARSTSPRTCAAPLGAGGETSARRSGLWS